MVKLVLHSKWLELTINLWDNEPDAFEELNTVHGEGGRSAVDTVQAPVYIKPQSWDRDNMTMLSGHNVVCNCHWHFTIFIVATPSRHWGLTIFQFFSGSCLVPEVILHCRVAKNMSRAQLWLTLIPLGPVCIIHDTHNGAHLEGPRVFHLYRN